jgi:toxin YoeB
LSPSSGGSSKRDCVLDDYFREDFAYWVESDRKTALRILRLMDAVLRDPFRGIGKPEPLKHLDRGAWSRRITQEHRLVYLVERDRITFLQARYHYEG